MPLDAKIVWMDGELISFEEATVPLMTHTLHYGYGTFEGIRAYKRPDGSHIFRLSEHIERLLESAHIIGMEVPYSQKVIEEACVTVLQENGFESAYLRPLVYLGDEAMGLGALNNTVHVAIASWRWGAYLGDEGIQSGIRCKISSYNRLHVNVNMVKGKICGHYVNSVMAKREALTAGYDEAIMLDTQGYVSECSGENLFMVKKGVIYTPPYGSSILGGITRDTLITLARDEGFTLVERQMTRDELYIADEVFLCGTAAELTPVREVDDRRVGEGRPGPITRRLSERFFGVLTGTDKAHPEWRHRYQLSS